MEFPFYNRQLSDEEKVVEDVAITQVGVGTLYAYLLFGDLQLRVGNVDQVSKKTAE